jgi:hypothetical protein
MSNIARPILVLSWLAVAFSRSTIAAPPPTPPDFDRDVAAIFASRCFDCHNPVEHKGELDLTRRDPAMAGGESGRVIVPGKPDKSRLWKNVSSDKMPPKRPLGEAEKKILERWIAAGANWGSDPIDPFRFTTARRAGYDWWSLQPLKKAELPATKRDGWARNPVDAFILAELEKNNLAPSQEADRHTLIRRLAFDLTGLPPTPEQVEAFLGDKSPDAYEKLVDRLLASPDYGVRWARHWLDAARFGESNGFERDQCRPNSWRYRDWVVNAFNNDMPYDQFVRMQLAGDVLEPKTADDVVATGFLVGGAYDQVGDTQRSLAMRAVVRQDQLEDQVGTVCQTFLGLTANCARCHDHKFDPIAQREYYQIASALSGVHHGERDLPANYVREQAAVFDQTCDRRIAEIKKQIEAIEAPVLAQLQKERKKPLAVTLPRPIAEWQFDQGLLDRAGSLDVTAEGNSALHDGMLQLNGNGFAQTPPLRFDLKEKTLEAWVRLRDLKQRGGGVISVQTLSGQVFDSIVFGERQDGHWMAGSEGYKRSQSFDAPAEDDAVIGFVHVAITWQADGTITCYRNGHPYGTPYRASPPPRYAAGKARILLGLRHTPGDHGKFLYGAIRKARVYDRALSADEIAASAGTDPGITESALRGALSDAQRIALGNLRNELQALRRLELRAGANKAFVNTPIAPAVTHLLYRGMPTRPGPIVSPAGIASIVGPAADFGLAPDAPDAERRMKLASWITDARNPLFSRVIVNRLWQYHFGAGIVETPNDFGFNGGRPSHPQLLDWLAARLQTEGYSLKAVHRLMITSAAYRQSSLLRPDGMQRDASNRLLWRMNPRRIEAEALRDAILQVAGRLKPGRGGPGFEDYFTFTQNSTFYEPRDYVGDTFNRRSLYRTWIRSGRNPLLDVFDCPDPSTKTPRRAVTTTPLQALALMNDSFILRMCDALAERVEREAGADPAKRVRRVYELTLCRAPTAEESEDAIGFVRKHGLAALCRVVLNSSEFVSVD